MKLPAWITLNRVIVAAIIILLIVAFLSIRACKGQRQEAEQAKQNTRSETAYSTAAKVAVAKVAERAEEEAELKEVVAEAAKDIALAEGSQDAIPPAAKAAALRAACRLPDYRNEPACLGMPDHR